MLTVLSDRPYTIPWCGHLHIWLSRATNGTRLHLSIVWLVITSCLPTITLTMFLETFKTIESLPRDLVGSRSREEKDEGILRCNFLKLTPGDRYSARRQLQPKLSLSLLLLLSCCLTFSIIRNCTMANPVGCTYNIYPDSQTLVSLGNNYVQGQFENLSQNIIHNDIFYFFPL